MSDMHKEFEKAFDKIMSDVKDGMDMGNKKDKPVYKDFDNEAIPEGFIVDNCRLRRNGKLQFLETPDGHKLAIKCPSTKQWCKGTEEGVFTCVGCKHYDDWLTTETTSFKKNDQGKLQWSLMPFEQLEDVVRVLMNGAKTYARDNWKKCDDPTRYTDALMRHVTAYVEGQKFDTEPGGDMLHHLAHAICDCLFIMYFEKGEITAWKNWLMEQENNLK